METIFPTGGSGFKVLRTVCTCQGHNTPPPFPARAMRLAAYITTFDRPVILHSTLLQFLGQTVPPEYVLVVDNGRNPETAAVVRAFDGNRVAYHSMGCNAGPAGAGAFALPLLADQGFDWIICGDDDDPPRLPDSLERLMRLARTAGANVGAVGATGTPWDWKRGVRATRFNLPRQGPMDVDVVGGSQLPTISRSAVLRVGGHNGRLFFGQEEFEYCLRIRKAGFRIVVDAELFRESLRAPSPGGPKRLAPGVHRPVTEIWRQYYGTRNYIHFMRREFGRSDLAWRETLKALARCARSYLNGPRYGLTYTSLQARGIIDGYRDRLGLTVVPGQKYPAAGRGS
jgi:glycosyltransferase involved in cell wall biosynthesis